MSAEQTTETARNPADMECPRCGYRVGTDGWTVCPECGLSGSDAAAAEKFTRELVERGGGMRGTLWRGFAALAVSFVVAELMGRPSPGVLLTILVFVLWTGTCILLCRFSPLPAKWLGSYANARQYRAARLICNEHAIWINLPWIVSIAVGWISTGICKIAMMNGAYRDTVENTANLIHGVAAIAVLIVSLNAWRSRYMRDCQLALVPLAKPVQLTVILAVILSLLAALVIPMVIVSKSGVLHRRMTVSC